MDMKLCIIVDWSCMDQVIYADTLANTPEVIERAELFAQMAIGNLTGKQVGNCPITVRPTGFNSSVGVTLGGHVAEVVEVKVGGVIQSPYDYRVDNETRLVRLGGDVWPTAQDVKLPDTDPDTFSVTYIRGVVLDSMGSFIAGLLAAEFLSACNGGECSLPAGITSMARQGVRFEFGPSLFPNGRTGIDAVDLWVESWNPYHVKTASRVHSVDVTPTTQVTWSA